MITVMIIDHESLALETGNTTKCMSCAPTIDLQTISNKQQPMSNKQQAMTHRLSVPNQMVEANLIINMIMYHLLIKLT